MNIASNQQATSLQMFYNETEGINLRTEIINGEPWFIAKDVCCALGLQDVSMTVKRLDDDEKLIQTLFVSGQGRETWTVNESGLYGLIFQSRKPEARAFRKWLLTLSFPASAAPEPILQTAFKLRLRSHRRNCPFPSTVRSSRSGRRR